MAIISISRGSYSRGTEVAEKVASRLGYDCLARDVLLEASEEFNIPEIKLVKAIEGAPSVFDRLGSKRDRYIAYIRAALFKHFLDDNVVYHGLAGHYFLQNISHALKVRILADLEDRVAIVVDRDNVSEKEARHTLEKADKVRRQWGLHLYGIDPEDPSLYDTVIHVGKVGTDGATDMICNLVGLESFQTTPASQGALEDLALAASVEALAVDMELDRHDVEVSASEGQVLVRLKSPPRMHAGSMSDFHTHYVEDLQRRLLERTREFPGMKSLEVELGED
jgi:cytidylate kinase